MKNLKISKKLLVGFGLVTAILLIIAILNFLTSNRNSDNLHAIDADSDLQSLMQQTLEHISDGRTQSSIFFNVINENAAKKFDEHAITIEADIVSLNKLLAEQTVLAKFQGPIGEFEETSKKWIAECKEVTASNAKLKDIENQIYPIIEEVNKTTDNAVQIRIQGGDVAQVAAASALDSMLDASFEGVNKMMATFDGSVFPEAEKQMTSAIATLKAAPGSETEVFQKLIKALETVLALSTEYSNELTHNWDVIAKADADETLMTEQFNTVAEEVRNALLHRVDESSRQSNNAMIIIVALSAAGLVLSVLIGSYISKQITRPMNFMQKTLFEIGRNGNLNLESQEVSRMHEMANGKDEIASCMGAMRSMYDRLNEVSSGLNAVSDGDLTVKIEPLSDDDVMGASILKLLSTLNGTFSEISNTSVEVAQNSVGVSNSSMSLAQGATQQAAAVSALSRSITKVAEKTNEAADMAMNASQLGDEIRKNAEVGTSQMDQMMDAVKQITEASASIGKVIKVIDDIAFQTNILALNAAVEAARAGQHGKGFAVVAEEVRNLAAKSADAAKETGQLIANSIEKADLGAKIANSTSSSLNRIVEGINESGKLVNIIAETSTEQTRSIKEINNGIQEVGEVVTLISRGAELSSNAAATMQTQSDALHRYVSQFRLDFTNGQVHKMAKVNETAGFSMAPSAPAPVPQDDYSADDFSGDSGKY